MFGLHIRFSGRALYEILHLEKVKIKSTLGKAVLQIHAKGEC